MDISLDAKWCVVFDLTCQDNSDKQYSGFRKNVPSLILLLFAHQLIQRGYNFIVSQWNEGSPVTSNKLPSIPSKLFASLPFSFIVICAFFGASALKILLFNLVFYGLVKGLKTRAIAPIVMWTYCITVLLLNYIYDGYRFGHIWSGLEWMDQMRGTGLKWHMSFNFAVLRMISFGMDCYWKSKGLKESAEVFE